MNRAERRARVFLRAPSPKAQPAVPPDPTKLKSGITPIRDELDALLEGKAFSDVPFAKRDEDLQAPTPFTPSETTYEAHFDRQRCEYCASLTNYFTGLFEVVKGRAITTRRLPPFARPVAVYNEVHHIPFCANCAQQKE